MSGPRTICISLGKRGRNWVSWARAAGADVVGVVDLNESLLETVGAALGFSPAQRFTRIQDAVRELRPEAAIACTPNATHYEVGKECLEAGLHLLIEKPLSEDFEQARDLVRRAERQGVQLAVGHQYRYRAGFSVARQAVQDGRLGELTGGVVEFFRWRPTQGMTLPLLLNQAVHHFDVLRYIVGCDPVRCMAELWNPSWNDCDGPTCAEATFLFANGARVHYSGSYTARGSHTDFNAHWRLDGSAGQLVRDASGRWILYTEPGASAGEVLYDPANPEPDRPEVALCRDFLKAVREGTPCGVSAKDNLKTLAMVFAVAESARLGQAVPLPA